MPSIDLNCDLGEGFAHDDELMGLIPSASIACGGHAGDEATMRAAVRSARRHGVVIGAHPGFADREHFGRRELVLPPEEIEELVRTQVRALQRVAAGEGAAVRYVKPHGALYNLADDIGEKRNLISLQPDRAARMAALLKSIRDAGRSRPLK